jgi:serine protease Do
MSTDRPITRPGRFWIAAGGFVAIGLVLGLTLAAGLHIQPETNAQTGKPAAMMSNAVALPVGSDGVTSPFVAVVQQAGPAVVSIDTKRKVTGGDTSDEDEMFRRFFGGPFGGPGGGGNGSGSGHPMTIPASGSGFLIDHQGHILTNNHVVRDASEITVTLSDKRAFKAKVVGQDPATDVAVIQIKADGDLPSLPLGDSDQIQVGEWVMAIGNPLGELQGSVTAGIVSARGRSALNIQGGAPDYQDFIQTDASINFGNSGGPLVNLRGEAIGINTAINAQGQGIGFAIPINLAKHIAEQLVASGKVVRGFLGVVPAELTPVLAESYGVASDAGVLVGDVSDNSPAARAGVHRGDIITAFDGQRVHDVTSFRLRVADTPVDKHVAIDLLRDSKPMSVGVTLANRDVMLAQATGRARGGEDKTVNGSADDPKAATAVMGVTVRELSAHEREALGPKAKGVVVTQVDDGSPADLAGISEGELIVEANGHDVDSPADLGAAVRAARPTGRPIRILREDVDWSSGQVQGGYVAVKIKE